MSQAGVKTRPKQPSVTLVLFKNNGLAFVTCHSRMSVSCVGVRACVRMCVRALIHLYIFRDR